MELFNFSSENLKMTVNGTVIDIIGTCESPWFSGKAMCEALGYQNIQKALFNNVKPKHKQPLSELKKLQSSGPSNFLWPFDDLSYHEGKAIYISEHGAYELVNSCNLPSKYDAKYVLDKFFYDIRYKHGIMDIFTFVKNKKLSIDVESDWFKELWYPLSKKRHILGTMPLLDWLGYEGEAFTQKHAFKKLLDKNNISYEEIAFDDKRFLEHPVMQREVSQTNTGNLKLKRWLVLETRNFKKAVLRLNTKSAEIIRDYYLNLEEACFAYAEYQANWFREKAEKESKLKDDQLLESMSRLAITEKESIKTRAMFEKERQAKEEAEMKREEERLLKEKAQRKMLRLKEITISQKERTISQMVYVSTSRSYAAQHRFKVGGVESRRRLKGRLSDYNGRSASGDEWYFCNVIEVADFRKTEMRIDDIIGRFRDKKEKEIYIMSYQHLLYIVNFICTHHNEEVTTLNEMLKDVIEKLEDDDVDVFIPDPIPSNSFEITRVEFGQRVGTTVIQTSGTRANKIQLMAEFEKYVKSLPDDEREINRKELFDGLSKNFAFNKNDAWVWLKEFISEYEKTFVLKYR